MMRVYGVECSTVSFGERVRVELEPVHAETLEDARRIVARMPHLTGWTIARLSLDVIGVRAYTPHVGGESYAVDGERGTYLITLERGVWSVWRSDSLTTRSKHRRVEDAAIAARRYAGAPAAEVAA